MHSLPLFVKLEGRAVILLGEGETADAKCRLLQRAGALVMVDERADAALAIVAIEEDALAEAAVARLKARGVLVNAVDRPLLCDFTLPAIVDRKPVLIAIGTGGASAGLAKALRQRLEALIPQSTGRLAAALKEARPDITRRWPAAADRRRAIDAALSEGGALDCLRDFDAGAMERWLGGGTSDQGTSQIETVILHSADPDDLTLRQARLLGSADALFHTADIAPAILDRARADAVRIPSDARPDWTRPGLALWLTLAG
jgi:uroporphyrin-III C-methyltransferase/precorrin-2 dehydrogenase/sirohydrochlorin ferrochelatase